MMAEQTDMRQILALSDFSVAPLDPLLHVKTESWDRINVERIYALFWLRLSNILRSTIGSCVELLLSHLQLGGSWIETTRGSLFLQIAPTFFVTRSKGIILHFASARPFPGVLPVQTETYTNNPDQKYCESMGDCYSGM